MAIKRKLPDEFRKNFSDSMYGSEVAFVCKTENPDYCLVYYNSNESESGLGMVPENQPVLTDGKGNKLAFNRLDGPQDNGSDYFYVLDDKVVVVSGVSAEERYKPNPVLEMEREPELYKRIFSVLPGYPYEELKKAVLQTKPFYFEDELVSKLSSHEILFAQLKNVYEQCLIAHRLEASGANVFAACRDAAKELGIARPFGKFLDEFYSDFADLLEMGEISHTKFTYNLLYDVSEKFPEVYKKLSFPEVNEKVRDSVHVDKSEVYGKIFETLLDLIDYGKQYDFDGFPLRGAEIVLNGETMPVKSFSKISFEGFRDDPSFERINADLNCLDEDGYEGLDEDGYEAVFTFIFTRNDAHSRGWDNETGNVGVLKNPDSMLSALSGVKNEYELKAYRNRVFSVLYVAYEVARPTNEVVRGNYAKEFYGEVKWSRALDFSVPGMPEVKGLRYKDFPDCTDIRLLMKDGNSKSVGDLTKIELGLVRDGLQKALKNRKGIRM